MNETLSGLSFLAATKRVFSKYAVFRGRATRSEYWWFTLAVFLLSVVVQFAFSLFGDDAATTASGLLSLAIFLPSLAVAVRRLHDIGRTGWWLLVSLIPALVAGVLAVITLGAAIVSGGSSPAVVLAVIGTLIIPVLIAIAGGIVLFIFSVLPSQPVDNKYGPAPVPASGSSAPAQA